eukprot:scaffold52637_cov37-Phaeocystis_antarctica.AAC.3
MPPWMKAAFSGTVTASARWLERGERSFGRVEEPDVVELLLLPLPAEDREELPLHCGRVAVTRLRWLARAVTRIPVGEDLAHVRRHLALPYVVLLGSVEHVTAEEDEPRLRLGTERVEGHLRAGSGPGRRLRGLEALRPPVARRL